MNLEPGKTYVRRLSAVSLERDATALRLRLERALAGADFHPPGLPASAILCVRQLSDRRANAAHTHAGGALAFSDAGGALAFSEWQRSVASAIERLARHAASPARGPVPANAEAVIFSDRAELLACLAADWCEEAAPARWWWRSLFGGLDAAAAMLSAWLDAPEHVPSALGRLDAAGKLIRFTRALSENEARSIRRRVVEKFGLYEVASALDSTAGYGEREALTSERSEVGDASEDARAEAERPAPRSAPWRRYVPELRGYGLGREQDCMAGLGLMLLRLPSRVRSHDFSESLKHWRFDDAAPTSEKPEQPRTRTDVKALARHELEAEAPPTFFDAGREASTREESILDSSDGDESKSSSLPATSYETTPRARVEHEGDAGKGSSVVAGFVAEVVRSTEADERVGLTTVEDEAEARPVLRQPQREEQAPESESGSWEMTSLESVETEEFVPSSPVGQARIQTRFGGLFYLINLGLFLNLYGDFTTPLAPGLALPLWDFLALLGERLCGERVREDAAWGLLAKLTGRGEDEPLGRDFAPEDEWRLPPLWLAPFREQGVWSWSDEGGRLRVRHVEGFLVLDVPLAREGQEQQALTREGRQLDEELQVYDGRARFNLRRAPSVIDDDEPEGGALERWLNRLLPYVNARLRRALGVGESDEAARLVCEQEARVRVTETRLDVTFALERLPVEVRLSGLDRDPGWVPAAGRYVAFDYE
jgi:hypothetical protein